MLVVDTDFDRLWVEESDRLVSEWQYLANALQHVSSQSSFVDQQYLGPDVRRTRMMMMMLGGRAQTMVDDADLTAPIMTNTFPHGGPSKTDLLGNGMPGREFMGTMETILQSSADPPDRNPHSSQSDYQKEVKVSVRGGESLGSSQPPGQILTPRALLDHMEFLVKVRRLQITVGGSKWSFKDLCQRASLPFGAEMHHIQAYLDMIIPCLIITPLDCFWEGAKVLGPEEAMWVPWFDERTLIQWTNIDPIGLLKDLQNRYGNYSRVELNTLIKLFHAAGINHGYLNRSCLDPTDPACPPSAPNYRGKAPDVASILNGGCPSFAANMLYWPEEIIIGGRFHQNATILNHTVCSINCTSRSPSIDVDQNSQALGSTGSRTSSVLISASALQSLILLRSPRDLYEAVRHSDPYKHEGWTLADAQHVLDEWRRNLRRFLYGLVCLLGWRDPVRSQCWLALSGLLIIALSSVAGLGICAALGLPFNVLTIQVLPFLLMGLGVDGVFTLTTCHDCCVARRTSPSSASSSKPSLAHSPSNSSISTCSSTSTSRSTSNSSISTFPAPVFVLAEHGSSMLFGTIAIAGAFFSASFIPIPLMRQFCLQAGILVLVQSVSIFILFPVLLQLDATRRSQRRLDVLCCLRQPTVSTTSLIDPVSFTTYPRLSRSSESPPVSRVHHGCRHRDPDHVQALHMQSRKNRGEVKTHCLTEPSEVLPCPSIQVSVVNQVADAGHLVTDVTCSRKPHACSVDLNESGHTVHTTVTVTGCRESLPAKFSDRPCEQGSSSRRSKDKGLKVFHSSRGHSCNSWRRQHTNTVTHDEATTRMPVQGSCPYVIEHKPSFGLRSRRVEVTYSTPSKPLLVRLARRLALLLSYHWLIELVVCLLGFGLFVLAGCLASFHLRLGLDWSTLAPVDTVEHGFVKNSEKAFGLYNFQVIARGTDLSGSRPPPDNFRLTSVRSEGNDPSSVRSGLSRARNSIATVGRGIDFPMQQRRLEYLYTKLTQLPGVMLAGRQFWLKAMRDWLQGVQNAFDFDRKHGFITADGRWNASASDMGVLGLRLIVQTDRGPELGRINTGRLVRGGIVDPPAFYALLRVWRTYDALNFSSLACVIHPEPGIIQLSRSSSGSGNPNDLHALPPAEPIEFVQTSFYVVGVRGMDAQLKLVQDVRALTESATAQGVPTFPVGVPFTFAEHYIYLMRETFIAIGIFFSIIFLAGLVLFCSPIIVLLLLIIGAGGGLCAALSGLVLLGLELNFISAGLLILSAGIGARLAAGFIGAWSGSHLRTRIPRTTKTARDRQHSKICLCQNSHTHSCSSGSAQYCHSIVTPGNLKSVAEGGMGDAEEFMQTRSNTVTPSSSAPCSTKENDFARWSCDGRHRDFVRVEFMRILGNQFAPALHTTVGLILALALLAAARVQFIADHFFYLILFVNLVCFFNATCLVPTLCYLIYPIRQFRLPLVLYVNPKVRRRRGRLHMKSTYLVPTASTSHSDTAVVETGQHRHPAMRSSVSTPSLTPEISSAACRTSASSCQLLNSLSPFPPVSTPDLNLKRNLPTSTQSQTNLKDVSLLGPQPLVATVSKSSAGSVSDNSVPITRGSQLYDLCGVQLRGLNCSSRHHADWLSVGADSPEAAAAAAAVVVAAAAAASVRSRPVSLSTISEEPSHSSSTVSLNRISSSANGGTSSNNDEHSGAASAPGTDTDSKPSPGSSYSGQLIEPVGLRNVVRLPNLDSSTQNTSGHICGPVFSSSQPHTKTASKPYVRLPSSRELLLDPNATCTLFAAMAGYDAARKRLSVNRSNPSPPPSYSSVIRNADNRSSAESEQNAHNDAVTSRFVETAVSPACSSNENSCSFERISARGSVSSAVHRSSCESGGNSVNLAESTKSPDPYIHAQECHRPLLPAHVYSHSKPSRHFHSLPTPLRTSSKISSRKSNPIASSCRNPSVRLELHHHHHHYISSPPPQNSSAAQMFSCEPVIRHSSSQPDAGSVSPPSDSEHTDAL
ncbi:unnamed protein product [Calicophoron daubneyi]|uniref:SSD domain-containing protein n=1 Tax=Calicophoron daubneyi TaxID=300641 RepID=A0AAV2TSS8_CALDB